MQRGLDKTTHLLITSQHKFKWFGKLCLMTIYLIDIVKILVQPPTQDDLEILASIYTRIYLYRCK